MTSQQGLLCLDSVTDYEKVVYKARDRRTGQLCALKKVRFDRAKDGVPVTSIRELRVLQQCKHPNIVRLVKVVTGSKSDSVFLVFEYCEYDLGRVLDRMPRPFTVPQIKQLMIQLLEAVMCLHSHWVLHRDIKMSNLLYCKTGQLKLCDLGLARYYQHQETAMTPSVVTLWYRAPELLLGAEKYGEAVDMWAVGCVLGELLQHRPLFAATSEVQALSMQIDLLGAPTHHTWPGMTDLPHADKFKLPHQPENRLHTITAPHRQYSARYQQAHRASADGGWHRGRRRDSPLSPERWQPASTSPTKLRSDSRARSRSRSRSPGAMHHRSTHRDDQDMSPARGRRHAGFQQQSHHHRSWCSRSRSRSASPLRSRSAARHDHSHLRHSPARHHTYSPAPAGRHPHLDTYSDNPKHRRSRSHTSHDGCWSHEAVHMHGAPDLALDLLSRLLAWDPARRLSAAEARAHPWFQEPPLPCPQDNMPRSPVREELPRPPSHQLLPQQHDYHQHQHQHWSRHQQGGETLRPGLMVDHTAERQRRLGDIFGGNGAANQRRMVLRRLLTP